MDSKQGWLVVFGTMLALTITAGVGFFSIAVLAESIIAEMDWTVTQFAFGVTVWGLSAAIVSPFCGKWIDKYGPRRMMLAGIVIAAAAEFMLGRTQTLWHFYVFLAIAPLGIMSCTYVAAATVVTHWFVRLENTAMALVMLGIGLGGGLFPLITRALLEELGWQQTFTALSAILLIAIVPVLIFVRSPRDAQAGATEENNESETVDKPTRDLTLSDALRTRSFWGLGLGDALTGLVFAIFNSLLVFYITKDTNDADLATRVFSVLSFGLGFGILIFGPLGDIFNLRRIIMLCYFLPAIGTTIIASSAHPGAAYSFAVIAGCAGGGRSALFPVAILHSFGGTHLASIYGLSNSLFMIGNAIGPVLAGAIYDATGNTRLIYGMSIGLFFVSAFLVSLIRDERPKSETS